MGLFSRDPIDVIEKEIAKEEKSNIKKLKPFLKDLKRCGIGYEFDGEMFLDSKDGVISLVIVHEEHAATITVTMPVDMSDLDNVFSGVSDTPDIGQSDNDVIKEGVSGGTICYSGEELVWEGHFSLDEANKFMSYINNALDEMERITKQGLSKERVKC